MRETYKTAITVGAILINDNNEVLLQKRCNTGYMDNMYALVAGHLEPNESMLSGIIREVKEEVDLNIKEENLTFICLIRQGDDNYINSYFKCNKFSGDIKIMEPEKCSELKWFNLNNLPQNIIPNDKRAIFNMINNITLDEYNF